MAYDRWMRLSEEEKIATLEKDAKEEQDKKALRAKLAKDLQIKGKGKGALKMQQVVPETGVCGRPHNTYPTAPDTHG